VFKFKPQQKVIITMIQAEGRISRCILEAGPQPIYNVHYMANSEGKSLEFYEDELEATSV
jgi:hypothetical protein